MTISRDVTAERDEAPSRLAFVGAGVLGQTYAGLIAASGRSVTLLATPRTGSRLLDVGRIRLRGLIDRDVPVAPAPAPAGVVGITATAADLPTAAGLIFATKSHQLPSSIADVRATWPAEGDATSWVAGVQNGLVKDDLLAAAFGPERLVGAVTILSGKREDNGEITITGLGMTYLGEFDGRISPRIAAARAILTEAGLPVDIAADIRSVLWSKECNAVGVFGVSVLTRLVGAATTSNPDLIRAYLALVRETAAVAAAYGVQVGDYAGFPIRTYVERSDEENIADLLARRSPTGNTPQGPIGIPSMTQDLLAGRPMEVDDVFSDVVERARQVDLEVPRITLVRDLIRGLNQIQPNHWRRGQE